jgi:hypothetical protein
MPPLAHPSNQPLVRMKNAVRLPHTLCSKLIITRACNRNAGGICMARKAREPPESVHSSERKIINELRVAERETQYTRAARRGTFCIIQVQSFYCRRGLLLRLNKLSLSFYYLAWLTHTERYQERQRCCPCPPEDEYN